jgi:putative serine protease PepD
VTDPDHLWAGNWRDRRRKGPPAKPPAHLRPLTPPREEAPTAAQEPPVASTPTGRRVPSAVRPALIGGAISAVIVSAVLLLTGVAGHDDSGTRQAAPASSSSSLPPASGGAGGSPPAKGTIGAIYAAASRGVVSVQSGAGTGTGFVVENDGTIVTNSHVVGNASRVRVRFGDAGHYLSADVLGSDPSVDLAVLHVDPASTGTLYPLQLANSDDVKVGDTAIAIGNPLGLDRTATAGIVSGLGREIQAPNGFQIDKVIQTDAPINPGNSGGPLLDGRGRVIGVNSQVATSGAGGGNIGFAVPSNTVRDTVPQLKAGQTPQHPYLGVRTGQGTAGAVVGGVTPGSPADRVGIRAGDVITEVDGTPVSGPDDISTAIDDNHPGDSVSVKVKRGGRDYDLQVTLQNRPATTSP